MPDPMVLQHEERLRLFRAEAPSLAPGSVVFLGDSLTAGFSLAAHFPGRPALNRGICSDHIDTGTAGGVSGRLAPELLAPSPHTIFLLIGINDIADHRNVSHFAAAYGRLMHSIVSRYPAARLVTTSMLPVRGKYAYLNSLVLDCNREIQELSRSRGISYLDLHSLLSGADGMLRRRYSLDGLHLAPPAYWRWRGAVARFMGWPAAPAKHRITVAMREMAVFAIKSGRGWCGS